MKIERTKNATRGLATGILLKIYQIIVPFLMRTAMIYFLGIQYLGLSSLFTSILQVLNLAELGVGSAMVFSMYKPIAEDDTTKICALMRLYKLYYRVIGLVIAIIGLAITPAIPLLVKGDIPGDINLYLLYILNLAATVMSYWLLAYRMSILQALQRVDVINKVSIISSTIQFGLQFLVIWLFRNYYLYVIVALLCQLLTNILNAFQANKLYPQYKPLGVLSKTETKSINKRIKDLFIIKVGTVIVNSCDSIVISAFLGLTILAVYQNYFFIITALIGFFQIFYTACTAGIGNSLVTDSKQKNYRDFTKITFMVQWALVFCTAALLCLYQPFMTIWVGEDYMLDFSIVILLCIYFYIFEVNQILCLYKDSAGIWHKDKYRSWLTSFANLAMNLVTVQFWGLYGVVLSTVLSTFVIGMPWLLHNLFSLIFDRKDLKGYVFKLIRYLAITLITVSITYFTCTLITGNVWTVLILRGFVCLILPNLVFILLSFKSQDFQDGVVLFKTVFNKK